MAGGGLTFHPACSEAVRGVRSTEHRRSKREFGKASSIQTARVSASDENESRQGGESDDGAQNVQHVHGCRLSFLKRLTSVFSKKRARYKYSLFRYEINW